MEAIGPGPLDQRSELGIDGAQGADHVVGINHASMPLSLYVSRWRIGWDSNPRNGYPFTRSPGACLQPLGHLSTSNWFNGWGGIRTHDALTGIPVFETGSFSHSDTHPDSVNKQRVPFSPRRLPSEP